MDIDFVVLWVDGNDPEWQREKNKYQGNLTTDGNSVNRFRDWGLMRYWFRAVEKYCPWVHKVHFVTYGHIPVWLNLNCSKLNHVTHGEYIPREYLPTFSANTIEMNVHRIPDLAEHFVFFNDDMFLLRPMSQEAFFQNGLPCTYGAEVPFAVTGQAGIWQHLIVNDMRTINNHFNKSEQVAKYGKKFTSATYRWQDNIRTKVLEKLFPEYFLGFKNLHAPASFCKSTFSEVWEKEPELLDATCRNKFRSAFDVNQWLAVWWQIVCGKFSPYLIDNVVEDVSEESICTLCDVIEGQQHDMICVNDPSCDIDFETLSLRLQEAFEKILPTKSSFEK